MTKHVWITGLALVILGGIAGTALADNWSLTLDTPDQTADPGGTAVFSGTITNDTGGDLLVDASLDFFTSPESELFTVDFADELLALDLTVPVGGYTGPLFEVTWTNEAPQGIFGEGLLVVSADAPADPMTASAAFTLHAPGVNAFCVEATGFDAATSSIAVNDSTGTGLIAYNDGGAGSLELASVVGQSWTTETIATGIGTSAAPSLGLDGNLGPHVVFFDDIGGDLGYAERAGGIWTVSLVDTAGIVGAWPSLLVEPSGDLHVSYYDATNQDLRYAERIAGVWSVEIAVAADAVAKYSSIALDESGEPNISYFDESAGALAIAWRDGGVWMSETIDAAVGPVGTWTSLAIRDGIRSIGYRDETPGAEALKLATGTVGSWTIETVDANGSPGLSTSLALNSFGRPRVAYVDGASGETRFASKTDGVSWEIGVVDDGNTIASAALAQSVSDEPFLSYGSTASSLRFASINSCNVVAAPESGLPATTSLLLHPNRPNPFSPATVISFTVGRKAETRVRIYDASGRLVLEPFRSMAEPGTYHVEWSGLGKNGHPVASGVYLYEVQSGDQKRQGRMVLLR
ncbi:MAG: T9SS type A sorting domain-containing protein [Planctomycetes bacterium]|nr:T9SS type A sorting domain-containing protein [Planctomycetota bacterium]